VESGSRIMADQEDFVSSMQRQVGWFVILGIGILLLLLLVVSVRTNVFAKQFYVYFFPPSASSFYEGQPVKFQGFAIGHVDDIELQEQGKVKITLALLDRYRHMIHENAITRVIKEGLIGEQVVEVTAGDLKTPAIREGKVLGYETEASFEQLLADLKPAVGNANVLLKELASLAVWMNDPDGDVRIAMSGLKQIAAGVKGEDLGKLVGDLQKFAEALNKRQVAKQLSSSLEGLANIVNDMRPFTEAMGKDGAATVEHMNALLKNVDQLSSSLHIVASDLSELTPELPGLARESRETIEEIKSLIKALQGSWLVGGSKNKQRDSDALTAPPPLDMRP